MSVLDRDSSLMSVSKLSGIHEDAVRCVFDERLNRSKSMIDSPSEQLSHFHTIIDDAYSFWKQTLELPEDYEGRREKVSQKLSAFFDRVIRYSEFHEPASLSKEEMGIRDTVIEKAQSQKQALETHL